MKLSKRIKHSDLSMAVALLERGRAAMVRHEWEQGETQEEWRRVVGNFFAILSAQLEYEEELEPRA